MMNWKKNIFSYILWIVYVLSVGIPLFTIIRKLGIVPDGAAGMAVLITGGILVLTGVVGVLLYMLSGKVQDSSKNIVSTLLVESALAVMLLGLGLVLRLQFLPQAGEQAMYFETAQIAEGKPVPPVVHGASYIFLMLLRVFFLFLGNKFLVGIWLQIVLQLMASLLLFIGIRKLAGSFAALIFFIFATCSGFAVQDALLLSPRSLFLFLFASVFLMLGTCKGKNLNPVLFLLCGIPAGIIGFLDVGGLLLIFFGVAIVLSEWEIDPGWKSRSAAIVLFILGNLAGFWGTVFVDALLSQKGIISVFSAWLSLYSPEEFRLPLQTSGEVSPWMILLIILLLFGIFSFWYDERHERMSVWIMAAAVTVSADCFGIFTDELPGSMYLFLSLAVAGGVGVQGCFRKAPAAEFIPTGDETLSGAGETQLSSEEVTMNSNEIHVSSGEAIMNPGREKVGSEAISVKSDKTAGSVRYIENPLPLPKPHKKKVLSFDKITDTGEDDFDHPVSEDDDYDIK